LFELYNQGLYHEKNKHPKYQQWFLKIPQLVTVFVTGSSAKTSGETIQFEGEEFPVIKVSISSSSHPFFNGDQKPVDLEGRLDKF